MEHHPCLRASHPPHLQVVEPTELLLLSDAIRGVVAEPPSFPSELFERVLEMERIAGKPWRLKHRWLRDLESAELPEGLREPTIITRRFGEEEMKEVG